ncbi:hypothetical protein BDP27DRAFT_379888 [Rhodocollybia butyracea]|uniref:Secreted protein n=1 Tax=Rhodocollybia butyracea TaxID=206335 RepID=A0A9P5U040_9AGAR|nr:hypothetical protein BDP27DRAFT_379888 [Rhodocollybia butyracea]
MLLRRVYAICTLQLISAMQPLRVGVLTMSQSPDCPLGLFSGAHNFHIEGSIFQVVHNNTGVVCHPVVLLTIIS